MTRTPTLPAPTQPITAAHLCDATGIPAEARGLAARGLPPSDQTTPTSAETAAFEIVTARIAARHNALDAHDHTIRAALAELPDPRSDATPATLHALVSNKLLEIFQAFGPVIRSTVAAEALARAELEAFRHRHGLLERSPTYPLSLVEHLAYVAVLILIEAAANMALFANASDHGLTGAFLTALAVAAVNVFVAVFAGILPLRHLLNSHDLPDHPNRARHTRLWATPALATAFLAILAVNYMAAHYRQVASTSDSFDEAQVIAHALHATFDLSLSSIALFAVGLVAAAFATYKGYSASDKYPGYEQQHRTFLAAAENRDGLAASLHGNIDTVRTTTLDTVHHRIVAVRAQLDDIRKRASALAILRPQTAKLDASDIAALSAALGRFRDLNLAVRTDGLAPSYFATPPDLSLLVPADPTPADDLPALIDDAHERHIAHGERLHQLYTAQLRRVETAKENADKMMTTIERSRVTDADIPQLSELRALIEANDQPAALPSPQAAA